MKENGIKKGKNYICCKSCGKPIEKTNNKVKWCEECANKILKEQWKTASKKYRDSKSS